jgi:hypothetical protein
MSTPPTARGGGGPGFTPRAAHDPSAGSGRAGAPQAAHQTFEGFFKQYGGPGGVPARQRALGWFQRKFEQTLNEWRRQIGKLFSP